MKNFFLSFLKKEISKKDEFANLIEESRILEYGQTVYYWHHDESRKGTITGISIHIREESGYSVLNVQYTIKQEEKEKGMIFFLDNVKKRFVCQSKSELKKVILNNI